MIDPALYEQIIGDVLRNSSRGQLVVNKINGPHVPLTKCFIDGVSYFGYAKLLLNGRELLVEFLYPTDRGTLIMNGREMSMTLRVADMADRKEAAAVDVGSLLIDIRPILSLQKRLRRAFTRSQRKGGTDYLEGLLSSLPKGLTVFDDTNILAEVASLQKVELPGGKNAAIHVRSLDESTRRVLCPLETPESYKIGLQLQIAVGNELERDTVHDGLILRASAAALQFGYSALMVPFLQHSDGARVLMGGKNMKQALLLRDPEQPIVKTGFEKEVAERSGREIRSRKAGKVESVDSEEIIVAGESYQLTPLYSSIASTPLGHRPTVKKGEDLAKGDIISEWPGIIGNEAVLGRNVLVGYLPFNGYNIDDGIVVSSSMARDFTSKHLYEYRIDLIPDVDAAELSVSIGQTVIYGDPLYSATLSSQTETMGGKRRNRKTTHFDKKLTGTVVAAVATERYVSVHVEALRPLEVGDKLSGRHGNKGVVTKIVPDEEMPSVEVSGDEYSLQVLLSPMGVVSRMNIGQLLETHFSWLVRNGTVEPEIGEPFRKLDFQSLERSLRDLGIPKGRADVRLDGRSVGSAVVGFQYFAKLNHMSGDKFHVRAAGENYSLINGQPLKGKRLGGGQRIGEMEMWAILAHRAFDLLHEVSTLKSDDVAARESLIAELETSVGGLLPDRVNSDHSSTIATVVSFLQAVGIGVAFRSGSGSNANSADSTDRIEIFFLEEKKETGGAADKRSGRSKVTYIKEPADLVKGEARIAGGQNDTCLPLIKLAISMPHPLSLDASPKNTAEWKLSHAAENSRFERVMISSIPVLPLYLRPPSPDGRDSFLTKLYKRVWFANQQLLKMQDDASSESRAELEFRLFRSVEKLMRGDGGNDSSRKPLISYLEGKDGLFRKYLLGKRQDFSGRAVIVPDPDLRIDHCGIPFEMLLGWLEPLVRSCLTAQIAESSPPSAFPHLDARNLIEWSLKGDEEAVISVSRALSDVIEKNKLLVLVNRQPSLHRYSLLAFKPVIRMDRVIGLPPMVCSGFNADFDGDTAAVYLPMTGRAQIDARRLMAGRHLYSVASGEIGLSLGQDYALGEYLIRKRPADEIRKLPGFVQMVVNGSGSLEKRVSRALETIGDTDDKISALKAFQDVVFEAASTGSASFGYFDILDMVLTEDEREGIDFDGRSSVIKSNRWTVEANVPNAELDDKAIIGKLRKEAVESADRLNADTERSLVRKLDSVSDNPFAAYFLSGAKGSTAQLRQVAGSVGGLFDMNGLPIVPISGSFAGGLDRDEYWRLCHSTRRTMIDKKLVVGEAGSLTRDLVEGAYELFISEDDCGAVDGIRIEVPGLNLVDRNIADSSASPGFSEKVGETYDLPVLLRSPLTCMASQRSGICRKCYGSDPATGRDFELGSLVGIIAGQSIGERGTQLTMQTFHSGAKGLSIKDIRRIFSYGKIDVSEEERKHAYNIESLWFNKIAADIIVETYGSKVLPIHFEVILRAMKHAEIEKSSSQTGNKTVLRGCQKTARDWKTRGFLSAASFGALRPLLADVIASGKMEDNLTSTKSRLMIGKRVTHDERNTKE